MAKGTKALEVADASEKLPEAAKVIGSDASEKFPAGGILTEQAAKVLGADASEKLAGAVEKVAGAVIFCAVFGFFNNLDMGVVEVLSAHSGILIEEGRALTFVVVVVVAVFQFAVVGWAMKAIASLLIKNPP